MTKENISYPRVLFATGLPNFFRGLYIANLYEIAKVYPVVLLAEELDSETEKILQNKELFPKLEKVIPYREFTGQKNIFSGHGDRCKLAKKVIEQYKPDILIAGDMSLFPLYLARFARKIKPILHVAIQGGILVKSSDVRLRSLLVSAHLKIPSFLPLPIRLFFTKCKRCIADFLYYWTLPLTVMQLPFKGKSSFISMKGSPCLRSCDYFLLRSRRDCDLVVREDGVPFEKLYIVGHPLLRKETREFFEKTLFLNSAKEDKNNQKIATLLYSGEAIGFDRKSHFLISKEKIREMSMEIIRLAAQTLKGWQIFIKPHPLTENIDEVKEDFESISQNIKVTQPAEPIDRYIEISDVIIGPAPSSTVLYTAALQCPEKIILSLDFYQELLGDTYKDTDGIEYIDNKEKFINILREIRDGAFSKKRQEIKSKLEPNEFSNLVEAIEYFLRQKSLKI